MKPIGQREGSKKEWHHNEKFGKWRASERGTAKTKDDRSIAGRNKKLYFATGDSQILIGTYPEVSNLKDRWHFQNIGQEVHSPPKHSQAFLFFFVWVKGIKWRVHDFDDCVSQMNDFDASSRTQLVLYTKQNWVKTGGTKKKSISGGDKPLIFCRLTS